MNKINTYNYINMYNKNKIRLITSAYSRFLSDKQKLTQDELMVKWSQCMVHDSELNKMIFRGNKEECENYIIKNNLSETCELYQALPGEDYFNWIECYRMLIQNDVINYLNF